MTYYEETPATDYIQAKENKVVNLALTAQPIPYLSGLKLKADVIINGLTLNTIDENNVVWVVSDIDGWWTLPDSELPDLPRGWGDGSYDAAGRWANRLITLSGSFLPQKPEDAAAARNALISAVTLIKEGGWLKVYEDGLFDPDGYSINPRGTYVRLSGAPLITSVNARGRHDFAIGLKAVDPIKYEFIDSEGDGYSSTVLTANGAGTGSVTLTNSGNVPVSINMELSLGFTIPGVTTPTFIKNNATDQEMVILSGTSSTNRLEIDTYNREVLEVQYSGSTVVNVANGRAKVATLLDWIYLQPGNNVITVAGFSAGATCTFYYRSGWIG